MIVGSSRPWLERSNPAQTSRNLVQQAAITRFLDGQHESDPDMRARRRVYPSTGVHSRYTADLAFGGQELSLMVGVY